MFIFNELLSFRCSLIYKLVNIVSSSVTAIELELNGTAKCRWNSEESNTNFEGFRESIDTCHVEEETFFNTIVKLVGKGN